MYKTTINRAFAMLLAIVVSLTFSFALCQEADAAAKSKNFWVRTSLTESWTATYGSEKDSGEYSMTYVINKNGFMDAIEESEQKTTYKRNKKGFATAYTQYDKKGKKTKSGVYKIKSNGDIVSGKHYVWKGNKKDLDRNTAYTYYKNGNTKKIKTETASGDFSMVWDFNKKGHLTKLEVKRADAKVITKYKNTFNKKGQLIKRVGTYSGSEQGSETTTYTYNKKGLLTKEDTKAIRKDSSGNVIEKSTTTTKYKYKKVKVAKKYWKAVEKDDSL